MSAPIHLVWFKRDLRVDDHAPLCQAAKNGPVLPLYIVEPGYWDEPDTSRRHWDFIRASLRDLDRGLRELGQPLILREGEAGTVLDRLCEELPIAAVHSHQETGNGWTFNRDRAVTRRLRERGIPWHEYRQHGVVRPLRSRDGWAAQWEQLMGEPVAALPESLTPCHGVVGGIETLPDCPAGVAADLPISLQAPGLEAGHAVLRGFLEARGQRYAGGISSPEKAWTASSRLSPHLAYGTLSLRRVLQATRERKAQVGEMPAGDRQRTAWQRSLRQFEERLHWHCHFMQKLEDQPSIEFANLHRACDGLREDAFDVERMRLWQQGLTGYPLVDACMRALRDHGWINFRMRAMVVAFASYHLWLHWREPSLHLARVFTDYEPGIHYSQMQMQSGTTGINALRIYNPVKQSVDQDPEGRFIRKWVPELARVTGDWIHQPWRMPAALQREFGCRIGHDYPAPIVDHEQAAREARARFKGVRGEAASRQERDGIQQRHGSRRRPSARTTTRRTPPAPGQLDLFPETDR
ncbi:FAD-binding domain-containing protein [Ectothiorhodospira variabilis]|uniref:FAD-binding domain-containing protein n=1 Tax=Ectothiorhodospira variabilis TaxID=505694 RepID=UPI001EFB983E|nr:deoxyribodipyrimidine photo-lyase [Ectothiorhodospira variabilis]MCG5496412.1 DNA photolyase family protein [Ectothiorhodospira variabilis]